MRIQVILIIFFITSFRAYPHQNKAPSPLPSPIKGEGNEETASSSVKIEGAHSHINNLYSQSIEPVFKKKCLDCHGGKPNFPWYYRLPLAKQLINYDVQEGKKHLDVSNGFPFKGHSTPLEDLKEIEKEVLKKTMPPWRYWLLHWDCRLTPEEEKAILNWVQESKKILQQNH